MKILKWILLCVATAATVAGVVFAVMNRAELCAGCGCKMCAKVKGFFTDFIGRFLAEDDFAAAGDEEEIAL